MIADTTVPPSRQRPSPANIVGVRCITDGREFPSMSAAAVFYRVGVRRVHKSCTNGGLVGTLRFEYADPDRAATMRERKARASLELAYRLAEDRPHTRVHVDRVNHTPQKWEELLGRYASRVRSLASCVRHRIKGSEIDDLVAAGNVGLVDALTRAQAEDENRSVLSFINSLIKAAMFRHHDRFNRAYINSRKAGVAFFLGSHETPDRFADRRSLPFDEFADAISPLPPFERTVIRLRFEDEATIVDIAKTLDVSADRVTAAMQNAFQILQQVSYAA